MEIDIKNLDISYDKFIETYHDKDDIKKLGVVNLVWSTR